MIAVNLFHMRAGKMVDRREFFWEDLPEFASAPAQTDDMRQVDHVGATADVGAVADVGTAAPGRPGEQTRRRLPPRVPMVSVPVKVPRTNNNAPPHKINLFPENSSPPC